MKADNFNGCPLNSAIKLQRMAQVALRQNLGATTFTSRSVVHGQCQGAIMSLSLALTESERVSGVVAMSGRILPEIQLISTKALVGLPVFVVHGTADPVLPSEHGRASRDRLQALPVNLTYREYLMAHEINVESLNDVRVWLAKQLALCCFTRN